MLCKKKKQKKKVVGLFLRSRLKIGTLTIRRSGMLRSYKFGSRRFDTFATEYFLCAINAVADASIHFLRGLVSAWLNCVALMRNVK